MVINEVFYLLRPTENNYHTHQTNIKKMNAVAGKLYGKRLRISSSSTTTQQAQQHLPQIIPTNGVPIHLYADEIEPQAMAQIKLLAESPIPVDYVSGKDRYTLYLYKHICLLSIYLLNI